MQVAKWGNSLAIRLPAALVQALQLKAGDHVDLIAEDRRTLAISRKLTREEAVARLAAHRAQLPVDYKFDREEANAR